MSIAAITPILDRQLPFTTGDSNLEAIFMFIGVVFIRFGNASATEFRQLLLACQVAHFSSYIDVLPIGKSLERSHKEIRQRCLEVPINVRHIADVGTAG
jgi:hypothetical protein